jgi:hypothetical protein
MAKGQVPTIVPIVHRVNVPELSANQHDGDHGFTNTTIDDKVYGATYCECRRDVHTGAPALTGKSASISNDNRRGTWMIPLSNISWWRR